MEKVNKIIELAFRDITKKGYFDIEKGNAPIPAVYNKPMSGIPDAMTKYVNECGYGCCFVFSAYMMKILNDYEINNYMIGTVEGNGVRASVMYEDDGEFYIANPVEDIEYFTENDVDSSDRKDYYIGDSATMIINGIVHDDSRYTLEEFEDKYGKMWIIGSMNKDSNDTLETAMETAFERIIMPPEMANYKTNKLLKKNNHR